MSSEWNELKRFPFYAQNAGLFAVNDKYLILVPPKHIGTSTDGVYKYIIKDNTWIKLISYQINDYSYPDSITYDKKNKFIYRIGRVQKFGSTGHLEKISLSNKTKEYLTQIQNVPKHTIIHLNNQIHFIGALQDDDTVVHSVMDVENTQKELTHYIQQQFTCTSELYESIYIKSRHSILLFGRTVQKHTWTGHYFLPIDCSSNVYEYSLLTNKCNKWDVDIPVTKFSAVISTHNERYLIIIGDKCKDIYVYDIKASDFRCSDIKCPSKMSYCATVANNEKQNELIAWAFINSCYKLSTFKNIQQLPTYLVKLIGKWLYLEQMIHIISASGYHWMISVDKIIT